MGALPAGGQYTNLSLSSFQIGGSDASSHSATSSVWSGNGVISVDFYRSFLQISYLQKILSVILLQFLPIKQAM